MYKYILVLLFLCSVVADEKSQHHLRKVSIDITSSYTNEKINAQVFLNKELIAHEQQLKPGNYQLQIQHSGYTTLHKEITIPEGSEPFLIKEKLHAKPRQISFELFYTRHSRGCPDTHEVIDMNTGKKVEFRDEFKPGEEQCFAVKFKQYQTRIVKAILPPGEDPYILQVPLIELCLLEFTIRKNSAVVDGIEYKYQFRFDNEPLEKHHIKIEKGLGRFYYTVMRPEHAKNFRAYIGYKFLQRPIARFRSGMSLGRPENLSVPKFIEHLDVVAKRKLGRLDSLQVVERFVKGFRHRKMLKQLDETQKDLLMNYLNSWKFDNEEHRVRLQKVIVKILSFYHQEKEQMKYVLLFICLATISCILGDVQPVSEGLQGKKAFDDLEKYYANSEMVPRYEQAFVDLEAEDSSISSQAGLYLLALLKQCFADETNGRAVWRQSPFWGGGTESSARNLRKDIAKAFAEKVVSAQALPAAMWLIEEELLAENQHAGVKALCNIKSVKVIPFYQRLLEQPHPNEYVVVRIIEEVEKRKLISLQKDVHRLCNHYRSKIRQAARKSVKLENTTDFDPQHAFSPWLEQQIQLMAKMVYHKIPLDARWVNINVTHPPYREGEKPNISTYKGWLVEETAEEYSFLDIFNRKHLVEKSKCTIEFDKLENYVATLVDMRKNNKNALSRHGGLTAQFEAKSISIPESLVIVWSFAQGDKKTVAKILFPCLDSMRDDRWLVWIVRDLLGHAYHQKMLRTFSHERNYPQTIALANHLAQEVFDNYQYQKRAKTLAKQLENRQEDFVSLVLPTASDWKNLSRKMNREEQIKYLISRFRLLNCIQRMQPGNVSYYDKQYAIVKQDRVEVINPLYTLLTMQLQISDLPIIVPFLHDDNYMPTISYWRSFHPSRTLHQVNWVVASVINNVAKSDLAQLSQFYKLTTFQEKEEHIAKIIQWCEKNKNKSQQQLLLENLRATETWREFEDITEELLEIRHLEAIPEIVKGMQRFPKFRSDIARFCYFFDAKQVVPEARQWINDKEEDLRFWGALTLLRHGNRENLEGLNTLKAILKDDDGSSWFIRAFSQLVESNRKETLDLACEILQKDSFNLDNREFMTRNNTRVILHKLFIAGRIECLQYLTDKLTSKQRDIYAEIVTSWRIDDFKFDEADSLENKAKKCQQLQEWLQHQFKIIQEGKKPDIKTESGTISDPTRGWLDAPGW